MIGQESGDMAALTPYDVVLARRAAGIGALLAAVAFVLVAATDEAASTLAGRLARLSALLPIAGGIGASIACAQARSRGEASALEAVGVPPFTALRGASLGGALVGAVGAAVVLVGSVDLSPLFPRVALAPAWRTVAEGFADPARGIVVLPSGELLRRTPDAIAAAAFEAPRFATALALFVAAVAVPAWSAAPSRPSRRLVVALAVATAAVAAFHLVGAGRLPPIALVVPPALLALDARRVYVHTARR